MNMSLIHMKHSNAENAVIAKLWDCKLCCARLLNISDFKDTLRSSMLSALTSFTMLTELHAIQIVQLAVNPVKSALAFEW